MGVLDDSSSGSDSDDSSSKRKPQNPQEPNKGGGGGMADHSGRMTPFARMKLEQQKKEETLYKDFCEFATEWLQSGGCVQKGMVVLYFREHFDNHKYKYSTSAEDIDIEEAMEKWNDSEDGHKAEMNEFGLYLGVQINAEHDAKVKEQEALERRKMQVKLIIADSKRSGVKPPLDVLKEAMELGVIEVPKATLDSMRLVGDRPRRASIAVPPSQPPPPAPAASPKTSSKKKKSHSTHEKARSSSRLGKSMGDLDLRSSERKERKKSPSSRDRKKSGSPSPTRERKKSSRPSSRLGKSMGDLDYKPSSRKLSSRDKDKDKDKEKEKKSSSRDKDEKSSSRSKKSSSARLHKSMGNLDYKPDKERKSKDKDKEKKSSSREKDKDKDKEKEKKSSSRDKEKDKEKKKPSRKSSRRSSVS